MLSAGHGRASALLMPALRRPAGRCVRDPVQVQHQSPGEVSTLERAPFRAPRGRRSAGRSHGADHRDSDPISAAREAAPGGGRVPSGSTASSRRAASSGWRDRPSGSGGATGSGRVSRGWCRSTLPGGGAGSARTSWHSSRRPALSTSSGPAACTAPRAICGPTTGRSSSPPRSCAGCWHPDRHRLHRSGQALAEWHRRIVQRQVPRRMPECRMVPQSAGGPGRDRDLAGASAAEHEPAVPDASRVQGRLGPANRATRRRESREGAVLQ